MKPIINLSVDWKIMRLKTRQEKRNTQNKKPTTTKQTKTTTAKTNKQNKRIKTNNNYGCVLRV